MHSIHSLPTVHSEHLNPMQMQAQPQVQAQQQQQQQVVPAQQQQMQHPNQNSNPNEGQPTDSSSTMTVLESLDPTQQQQQQVMGLAIDPASQQTQLAVQQHLVQPSPGHLHHQQQQQHPHLHQLQPSHVSNTASMDSTSSQLGAEQTEQQQQQLVGQQQQGAARPPTSNTSGGARQRAPIEGIVADGGGPIVQWLLDNYEIAEGESLPRSTVYNHYLAHCRQLQMASVNAASFGKLIRSVFIGLKTRRLGTRGHSKYHYFGVRAKQHIQQELLQHQEGAGCSRDFTNNENSNQNTDNGSESDSTGNGLECGRLSAGSSGKRIKRSQATISAISGSRRNQMYPQDHHLGMQQQQQPQQQHLHHHQSSLDPQQDPSVHHQQQSQQQQQHLEMQDSNGLYYATATTNTSTNSISGNTINGTNGYANNKNGNPDHMISSMEQTHCELEDFRNHLGANWATLVDEHWPQREACLLERQLVKVTGISELANSLELFEAKYKSYYKRMVELLSELKFLEVEQLWQEFWHPTNEQHNEQKQQQQQHWLSDSMQTIQSQQHQQVPTNGTDQQQQQQKENGQQQSTSDSIHHHHHHHQQQQMDYQQQQQQQQQHEVNLTYNLMYQLTSQPMIVERINEIDYSLYAAIESFLLPDLLSPIPRPLAKQILWFANNICPWIECAIRDYEHHFVAGKSKSARAFSHALRRYTWLNHLSTASRAIWEKRSSLDQMSIDLSRVDLRDIEHQVSLMSHSGNNETTITPITTISTTTGNLLNPIDLPPSALGSHNQSGLRNNKETSANNPITNINLTATTTTTTATATTTDGNNENNLVVDQHHHHHPHQLCAMQPGQLIQNFLHLLEDPYPANSWPDWCRNLVESRVCGLSLEEARNFVLKWNFYISLISKELTLRSAPSLSSFQLIRLLFDEYIFYLVVTRLAQAQHKTPAQLLSL